ncbi:MAG: oligosaccharide flippase family protein, partial [Planctomycetes bacterium]|nr:oligosaccharide flippase family protein [Planctomycetota bacterium]
GFILLGGADMWARWMENEALAPLLYVMAPYAVIRLLRSSLPPCFMSADKARVLAVFNAVSRLLECACVIAAVAAFGSLFSVVAATALGAGLALIAGVFLVFRIYRRGSITPAVAGLRRQIVYAAPLGLAAVFGSMMGYIDRVLVSMMVSPAEFAEYDNGAIRLPLLPIVVMSVTAVLLPELTRMYKSGDKAGMLRIWQAAMIKSSYVVLPAAVFLMILADDAVVLLFSDRYAGSVPIFRVFLVLLPFQMVSYGPVFHASNNNRKIVLINAVTLVIHIPLLFFFVRHMGIMGAAITTVFSQVAIRILLHIVFIANIVERPVARVIPLDKLMGVLIAAMLLALPLALRYTFDGYRKASFAACAIYYFPVCYLWLTRRLQAPRIAMVERCLRSIWIGRAS